MRVAYDLLSTSRRDSSEAVWHSKDCQNLAIWYGENKRAMSPGSLQPAFPVGGDGWMKKSCSHMLKWLYGAFSAQTQITRAFCENLPKQRLL